MRAQFADQGKQQTGFHFDVAVLNNNTDAARRSIHQNENFNARNLSTSDGTTSERL
jgi:hypothetical protein